MRRERQDRETGEREKVCAMCEQKREKEIKRGKEREREREGERKREKG